jgi:23S rRNA (uracil1939-C5)-methyltransferase
VLIYLSCEPDTLGRDLADLARLGLRCDELAPYDMMPHTDEVETVAVLRAATPPAPTLLGRATELWALDKPGHEPTVPSDDGTPSLLLRASAMAGLEGALAVQRLDADTSGVCLLASSAASAARWAKALGEADSRKEYLALCRGITRAKGVVSRPSARARSGSAHPSGSVAASAAAAGAASQPGAGDAGRAAGPKQVRTRYRRLEVVGGHSLLRVSAEHGRPQDIRRQLASLGHPVLGDVRHGHAPSNRHLSEKHGLDRAFLHCARIVVTDPTTQRRLEIQSPLAGDLQLVLDRLTASTPSQGTELDEAGADRPNAKTPSPPRRA